jgi:imidazolonepropionase-like amidohydrolase
MALILRDVRLIDGTGNEPRTSVAIVVEKGKVVSIQQEPPRPRGDDQVIDLDGRTLIPGLIDTHIHVGLDGTRALPDLAYYCLSLVQGALKQGVTTLRDVGSRDGIAIALRRAIARGQVWGPRLMCAGRAITMTGGHGNGYQFAIEADGIDGVIKAVRQEIRAGADLIKVCTTHRAPRPEFTLEELTAIVVEAHRLDRKVACHAGNEPGMGLAVAAGVDSIEHGALPSDETIAEMGRRGTAWVPTLCVMGHGFEAVNPISDPPVRLADLLKTEIDDYEVNRSYFDDSFNRYPHVFTQAKEHGILIGAGTDAPLQNLSYWSVQDEVVLLVQYGLSPMEAILAATANNARILGLESELGQIRPGMTADLVALSGDPLSDITEIRNVSLVIHKGVVIRDL